MDLGEGGRERNALGSAQALGLGHEPLHPLFQPPRLHRLQQKAKTCFVALANAAHAHNLAAKPRRKAMPASKSILAPPGAWNLGFGIFLELGIWDLELL